MRIRLLLLPVLIALLAGCDQTAAGQKEDRSSQIKIPVSNFGEMVVVVKDDANDVTCWLYTGFRLGSISCIPNDQLKNGGAP